MPSYKTFLKVKNNTTGNIITRVRNVDNFDWGSNNRPDHNFDNQVIGPHRELIMPEDINTWATANLYTLDLIFDDATRVSCRIDQGIASGRKGSFLNYIPNVSGNIRAIGEIVACIGDTIYSSFEHNERGILGCVGGNNATHTVRLSVNGNIVLVDVV